MVHTSWLTDSELWDLLEEDVPVMDPTSLSPGIGGGSGEIEFYLRQDGVAAGVEEAARLLGLGGLAVTKHAYSGKRCAAGDLILSCRGATVHRLGLSESILIFAEHRRFLSDASLATLIAKLKTEERERSIAAEARTLDEAKQLAGHGVGVIQFEKMEPDALREAVVGLKAIHPHLLVAAAGGITPENAETYAKTGVDFLVTSSVFHGKPADVRVQILSSNGGGV